MNTKLTNYKRRLWWSFDLATRRDILRDPEHFLFYRFRRVEQMGGLSRRWRRANERLLQAERR